jgi:cytochrome c-type biogenesis protein CcmH
VFTNRGSNDRFVDTCERFVDTCKGTAASLHQALSRLSSPFGKGGLHQALSRLSSPFEKGGPRGICLALFLLLSLFAAPVFAQKAVDAAPLQFRDTAEEQRFHDLVAELRCVMCQNQSLADSNAQIAVDLRREVLALMREGRSDQEVRDFLVERYGEFVLYRPLFTPKTWLLWFGPLLFALGGGLVVWRLLRRNRAAAPPVEDDNTQEW